MTDLERRLVASLEQSADLLEEWIVEAGLPRQIELQGGQVVDAMRMIAIVVPLPREAKG